MFDQTIRGDEERRRERAARRDGGTGRAAPARCQARRLEAAASGPSTEAVLAEERARSHEYGGRSVFGFEPPPERRSRGG